MRTTKSHASDVEREQLLSLVPALELVMTRALGPGDDAVDAVQEVLTRALTALDEVRPIHESLGAFVHGIAMHVVSDIRRTRHDRRGLPDSLASRDSGALDRLIRMEERARLRRALRNLDDRDQRLLRRCFTDGAHIVDLAKELHEPASRIRKRKSRAVQRLRRILMCRPGQLD